MITTQPENKVKIKEIKFQNMGNHPEEFSINFGSEFNLAHKSEYFENIKYKVRKNSKNYQSIYKILGIIGRNASYKTSTLSSIMNILTLWAWLDKTSIAKKYFFPKDPAELDKLQYIANKVIPIDINNTISPNIKLNKYLDNLAAEIMNDNYKQAEKLFFKDFYINNAYNSENPLYFSITYFDYQNNMKTISIKIFGKFKKNEGHFIDDYSHIYKINNVKKIVKNISLKTKPFIQAALVSCGKIDFAPHAGISLIQRLFEILNADTKRVSHVLNKLDPTIIDFQVSKYMNSKIIRRFSVVRSYNNETPATFDNIGFMSTGNQLFLQYLVDIFSSEFIIFDEIENSMHLRYIQLLLDIAKSQNKQIIFTTHSAVVVQELLNKKQVLLFNIDEKSGKFNYQKSYKKFKPTNNLINTYIKDWISSPSTFDLNQIFMEVNEQ